MNAHRRIEALFVAGLVLALPVVLSGCAAAPSPRAEAAKPCDGVRWEPGSFCAIMAIKAPGVYGTPGKPAEKAK